MDRDAISFLNITFRVPTEGAPPTPGPLYGTSSERERERERLSIPGAPFIHLSNSTADEPSFRFPCGAPMERDARLQRLFYISFRVPSKGTLPPGSLHRAPTERDASPPEPLSTISRSPH